MTQALASHEQRFLDLDIAVDVAPELLGTSSAFELISNIVDYRSLEWIEDTASKLREALQLRACPSQKRFWRLFDARVWSDPLDAIHAGDLDLSRLCLSAFMGQISVGKSTSVCEVWKHRAPQDNFLVIDGQHRLAASRELIPDLSSRDVRDICEIVLLEFEKLRETLPSLSLISHIRTRLIQEVSRRIRWRGPATYFSSYQFDPSTRDLVLYFAIHTGNPPPAMGYSRPAVRRACMSPAARKVDYESVRRRHNSANLRESFWQRRAKTYLSGRARANPYFDRGPQPARRVRARHDRAVGQCA